MEIENQEVKNEAPRLGITLKVTREFPFSRMAPNDPISKAICKINNRKTLKHSDLELLDTVGFDVEVG